MIAVDTSAVMAIVLGDCFFYATAVTAGVPLMFKGSDFNQTDVRAVL